MVVKVVSERPVRTKKVVCTKCGYELEYTGEDIHSYTANDYGAVLTRTIPSLARVHLAEKPFTFLIGIAVTNYSTMTITSNKFSNWVTPSPNTPLSQLVSRKTTPRVFNPLFLKTTIVDMDDVLRSPHLVNTCRALSLGGGSGMNACLTHYGETLRKRSVDACGIFAHYLDVAVGWLLFTYEDDCAYFKPKEGEAASHIFVHLDWRRLGIGTRLLQLAARMASPDILRVYEHNNIDFFHPLIQGTNNLAAV